jgi:fructokinase
MADADALCFGTLAQRSRPSRDAIRELIGCARPGATILLDINLRPPTPDALLVGQSLALANALKLNETELPAVAEMLGIRGDADGVMRALAERFNLRLVILTLGPGGSRILRNGEWTVQPGRKAEPLVDTVGAGDAFTATLLLGLARGFPTAEAAELATEIAAYVCTQSGATPRIPDALRRRLG